MVVEASRRDRREGAAYARRVPRAAVGRMAGVGLSVSLIVAVEFMCVTLGAIAALLILLVCPTALLNTVLVVMCELLGVKVSVVTQGPQRSNIAWVLSPQSAWGSYLVVVLVSER
jgi:hypothetical protein